MMVAKKKLLYVGVPLVTLILVVGIALGFIFCYKNPVTAVDSRKKLVIDHDGGADDAIAITLSLLNEKYFNGPNLIALTTTFGNVNLTQSIINSDRILTLCNRKDVPIYRGAEQALVSNIESDHYYGYDGLGDDGYLPPAVIEVQTNPSAVALVELSKKYEGELIVVAIGPVTNIALASRLDPNFIQRLAQLYIGAGHVYSEQFPKPEFNVLLDPEAYYIVADIATQDKVTLVPFSQVITSFNISKDWRENVLGKIQTAIMHALNGFERISFPKESNWHQLDPAVAAIALDNNLVDEFRNTSNGVILEGDKRGINTNDFTSTDPNARAVYAANIERYKEFLLKVYSAELTSKFLETNVSLFL